MTLIRLQILFFHLKHSILSLSLNQLIVIDTVERSVQMFSYFWGEEY